MDKKLKTELEKLHNELNNTELIDEDSKAALLKLKTDIELLLNKEKIEKSDEDDNLIDELKKTATKFEGTHPELSNSIHIVIHTLSNMGI